MGENREGRGPCATCKGSGYVLGCDDEETMPCPDCHATGKRPTVRGGKRVAIVGSRNYPDLEQVRAYVRKLPMGTVVVSGGAVGVDTAAAQEAVRCHLEVVVYDPSYELHGRRAPLVRNAMIVEDCDQLIAFHDGKSTGTMHTVGLARKAGKFVELWRAGRDVPTRTVHIKHCSCGGPFGCDLHPEAT